MHLRRHLPLLVAAGANLLLRAAFFDLLPNSVTLGMGSGLSVTDMLGLTLISFLVFLAIENVLDFLSRREARLPGRTLYWTASGLDADLA